jgi:predicted Zn-dependent protease
VAAIVDRLKAAASPAKYEFEVYVAEDDMVNALAAPGGYIVIFRGLLNKTKRPEEAAAVLAHEMQHVIRRHSVRGLMRNMSIWLAMIVLTGGGDIASIAGTIGGLHYQRADEDQADEEGIRMMNEARIDPRAMVSMLELLDKVSGDAPEVLKYVSSHPMTRDRIERMEKMAGELGGITRPLLSGETWPPAVARCRKM